MVTLRRHWPEPATGKLVNHDRDLGPGTPDVRTRGGMGIAAASQRPDSTVRREQVCGRCGKTYVVVGAHARVFCGDDCRMAARRERRA